ncbi:MAG: metal-sensing transcriptional repressor [Clostridiales bacterium]|nr:metal-sensing transcriptional repressor [Clostridiales bacterium]
MAECEHCKSKHRSDGDKKRLISRLNRIEGQIRGIRNMVETDRYCLDIVTQISAATSALNSLTCEVMSDHIKTCVKEDVETGSDEKLDELVNALYKLMK